MKEILRDFKEFAVKGNVVDLAVGLIVGAAFGKVVTSLVEDVVMPPIGVVVGGINFTDLKLALTGKVDLNYGSFLQNVFNFTITAFAVFWIVKIMNRLKKQEKKSEEVVKVRDEVKLLEEIRDLLKKK